MKCLKTIKTAALALIITLSGIYSLPAWGSSRIKDIVDFEGVRDNQLVGYGLVVGLNGTGDNIKSIDFTKESLISMLDQIGINARGGQIKSKNIAAVMVTANLPAFSRQGSRIDVMVSALGDAKNLQGGTLWQLQWLALMGRFMLLPKDKLPSGVLLLKVQISP